MDVLRLISEETKDYSQRIQNKAIQKAMGYRNSTSINVMLGEANEPPLNIRFSYVISKYNILLVNWLMQ